MEYTYAKDDSGDEIYLDIESEDEYVTKTTELKNPPNDEKPPKFKGYDLCDFAEKVIVGNFKLPHIKAAEMFSFLEKKTGGLVFLTLEIGQNNQSPDISDEHLHFGIAHSKITPDTLKTYIRKTFPSLVRRNKGGDKKYEGKYAKDLPYQILYIFKERNPNFFCNIDEVNLDKELHINHYADEFEKMKTLFSSSPAGKFYEFFMKHGGVKIGDELDEIDMDGTNLSAAGNQVYKDNVTLLRGKIAEIAIEYALETDNPNPGFQYLKKLIDYTHLRIHQPSYQNYILAKLNRDYNY